MTSYIFYYYKSTSDRLMPSVFKFTGNRDDALAALGKMFENSETPIVLVLYPFANISEIDNLIYVFQAWKIATPVKEAGLLANLNAVMKGLIECMEAMLKDNNHDHP